MAIFELYSTRKKKINGDFPDVYQYETLPDELKVQIVQIIKSTIGLDSVTFTRTNLPDKAYKEIHDILCREYGVFSLSSGKKKRDFFSIFDYFLESNNIDECLDIIELSFYYIDTIVRENQYGFLQDTDANQESENSISELNQMLNIAA